jgi:hypothetical protein
MLTPEQIKKLDELKACFLLAAGSENAEMRKLLVGCAELAEIVKGLSRSRPEEYAFPAHAALMNDHNATAFVMRLRGRVLIEQKIRLDGVRAERPAVINHPVVCAVEASSPFRERLSEARLSLAIDGDLLIERGLLRDHLADEQGLGFRGEAFSLRNLMPRTGPGGFSFFRAVHAIPDAHPQFGLMPNGPDLGWQIQSGDEIGMFLPNGSTITVDLEDLRGLETDPLMLTVGVVACQYTTKSDHALPKRKQDWSPRDPA